MRTPIRLASSGSSMPVRRPTATATTAARTAVMVTTTERSAPMSELTVSSFHLLSSTDPPPVRRALQGEIERRGECEHGVLDDRHLRPMDDRLPVLLGHD